MKRCLGLVLLVAASCGHPATHVAMHHHRLRLGPALHDRIAEPTTSSALHAGTPRAGRSAVAPRRLVPQPAGAAPLSPGDIWLALANCESHGRQDAYNPAGPYYSFFQWTMSSFHSAGGVGDPRDSNYATQLPLVKHWAAITNPYKQWPVCWPRVHG